MTHAYNPVRARLSQRQAMWLGQLAVGTPPRALPFQTLKSLKNLRLVDVDGRINEYGHAWLEVNPRSAPTTGEALRGSPNVTYHNLLSALGEALETTDWHQLTIKDITQRAEVKVPTFHHYFESIPEAARLLFKRKEERGQKLVEYERRLKLLLDWEDMRRADPDGAEEEAE